MPSWRNFLSGRGGRTRQNGKRLPVDLAHLTDLRAKGTLRLKALELKGRISPQDVTIFKGMVLTVVKPDTPFRKNYRGHLFEVSYTHRQGQHVWVFKKDGRVFK